MQGAWIRVSEQNRIDAGVERFGRSKNCRSTATGAWEEAEEIRARQRRERIDMSGGWRSAGS